MSVNFFTNTKHIKIESPFLDHVNGEYISNLLKGTGLKTDYINLDQNKNYAEIKLEHKIPRDLASRTKKYVEDTLSGSFSEKVGDFPGPEDSPLGNYA